MIRNLSALSLGLVAAGTAWAIVARSIQRAHTLSSDQLDDARVEGYRMCMEHLAAGMLLPPADETARPDDA